jgi:hypothetical protein
LRWFGTGHLQHQSPGRHAMLDLEMLAEVLELRLNQTGLRKGLSEQP